MVDRSSTFRASAGSGATPSQGSTTTQAADNRSPAAQAPAVPGLIVMFANQRPRFRVLPWQGAALELGRVELAEDDVHDTQISRRHARLRFDGSSWQVEDLSSRNGTFVHGKAVSGVVQAPSGTPIRIGGALVTPVHDTLKVQRYGLGVRDGAVSGPSLRQALEAVALARKTELLSSLLISGESGTGKEIAARVFHAAGLGANAPFVAVNCATIPKELAERLLFGSRRGAYSGATDASGYVQAAHGGTLFLDEVAELPAEVQTKLLRMLETREVLRLGATTYERVDVRVCAATWRDLRGEVAAGHFREDLYYRIGQPEVRLPALRERIEEIPWHARQVLDESAGSRSLELTVAFVEACALRPWPGNVRELRAEVRRAAGAAVTEGRPLGADDLSKTAGLLLPARAPLAEPRAQPAALPADEIAEALQAERGNVLAAARRLGIQRNKIRRWLERHGIDARRFKADGLEG
jgi:transcriptional regulator of acetoin/glycerol metabolism